MTKIYKFRLLIALCCIGVSLPLLSQNGSKISKNAQKNQISEYVEVVNTEVVVRALKNGRTVGDLQQPDFTLFEDGKPVRITSFQEIRRKVGTTEISLSAGVGGSAATAAPAHKKRLFFMYFWISEPDPAIRKALRFFFKKVYRDGDYVLVMIRNKLFKIVRSPQVNESVDSLFMKINKEALALKLDRDRMVNRLDKKFREFMKEFRDNEMMGRDVDQKVILGRIIDDYKNTWIEYKNQYMVLSTTKLKAIASSLKTLDMEKWGLVFYQHDTFPEFNLSGVFTAQRKSYTHVYELQKSFERQKRVMQKTRSAVEFFKELQQAFIEANTTFHLMLSDSKSQGELESFYVTMSYIHSDWEQAFADITQATGGQILNNNHLEQALEKAVESDDIYYRLTYAPDRNGKKERKIAIKVNDKRLKLMFHKQFKFQSPAEIAIENFSYTHPQLVFTLKNYRRLFDGNRLFGDVGLRITRLDQRGKRSVYRKQFIPETEDMVISMRLNFPGSGEYRLLIEAYDWQTGKSSALRRTLDIPIKGQAIKNVAMGLKPAE